MILLIIYKYLTLRLFRFVWNIKFPILAIWKDLEIFLASNSTISIVSFLTIKLKQDLLNQPFTRFKRERRIAIMAIDKFRFRYEAMTYTRSSIKARNDRRACLHILFFFFVVGIKQRRPIDYLTDRISLRLVQQKGR